MNSKQESPKKPKFYLKTDRNGTNVSITAYGNEAVATLYLLIEIATSFKVAPLASVTSVLDHDELKHLSTWNRSNPNHSTTAYMDGNSIKVQMKLMDPRMPAKTSQPQNFVRGEMAMTKDYARATDEDKTLWIRVHNVNWMIAVVGQLDVHALVNYHDGSARAVNLTADRVRARLEGISNRSKE